MWTAPHFALEEFQSKSDRPIFPAEEPAAQQLAERLETIRAALGHHPVVITSYIRHGARGQHGNGTAVDFEGVGHGLTQRQVFDRVSALAARGALGDFGQLIFYPFSDEHIHLSLFTGTRHNQILIANAAETEYDAPTPGLIARIPGSVTAGVALLALAGLGWLALRRGA